MRLIAIALVVLSGALLLGVDILSERRGFYDELGFAIVILGLIALGIELYIVPIVKWKFRRD